MVLKRLIAMIAGLLLSITGAGAETARELKWADLIPKKLEMPTPLDRLDKEQRRDIEFIAWVRTMRASGTLAADSSAIPEAERISQRLSKDGLDVPRLVDVVATMRRRQRLQQKRVVTELDGQFVRIPGYAVPLSFTGSKISEFLLVPYVGACIHVPPPPPNQIVYVEANKSFRLDGLFTPVWVTGRLAVKKVSKALSLVDGTSNIDIGYALKGGSVERMAN